MGPEGGTTVAERVKTTRDILSESIAAELQIRLPEDYLTAQPWGVLAQHGYIYVQTPQRLLTTIFWPDGVSLDMNPVLPNPYFLYCDPAFPDNLMDHIMRCVAILRDYTFNPNLTGNN